MRPALFLMIASPLVAVAQPSAKFTSADGKFAVSFPGTPTESKKPLVPNKPAVVHITRYEDAAGGRLVMWNEIAAKGYDPAKLLAGAAEGIGTRGKLVSNKEATFGSDKAPARELVVDSGDGPRLRYLLTVAHNRLYQVVVTGSNEFVAGPQAEAFRQSFELLK